MLGTRKKIIIPAPTWVHLLVRLAYYPPYHSKYNAIEHCWGILEQHWDGELLEDTETVLGFARTMTWNGRNPVVELMHGIYPTGVRLTPKEMNTVKDHVTRDNELGKWFLEIGPVGYVLIIQTGPQTCRNNLGISAAPRH